MQDEGVPELRSKAGVRVAIAAGVVTAIAVAVAVAWVLFGKNYNHSPSVIEKRELADEVCPKVTVSHFYKLEKDGKTSWLLGTRHAGVSLAKYPPGVGDAFRAARVAVFESNMADKQLPSEDVAAALGPDDWAKYEKLVGSEVAAKVRDKGVQLAATALAVLYEDRSQTLDKELQQAARDAHKQVVALEDQGTSDHLAETYVGIDTLRKALAQIPRRELLKSETARTLHEYCATGQRSDGSAFDKVTNARTRAWVDKLVPLLEQGGVFVAVGVDHVDRGTLDLGNLLAQRGFVVTRVP
ncbi:MAG: TraB/GumN family protein [Acidobacteriota bacterium]